ncbi:hypothetical protein MMC29_000195 [Sticta canariensis]|nr:hypothetical protein [Sticta canariensis]
MAGVQRQASGSQGGQEKPSAQPEAQQDAAGADQAALGGAARAVAAAICLWQQASASVKPSEAMTCSSALGPVAAKPVMPFGACWQEQDEDEADAAAEREHNLLDGVHLNGYRSPRAGDEPQEDDSLVYFISAYSSDQLPGSDSGVHDSLIFVGSRDRKSGQEHSRPDE